MNKERELLKEIMSYFAKGDITIRKFEDSGDIAETFHSAQELLAQPVKYQFTTRLDQESVMYQYRDKLDGKDWGRWNLCNKIDYEDYKNNPTFQHWTYQTRKLLAQPEEEGVYQKILRIEDGIEVEIFPSELWLDGYETGRKDPQKRESIDDGELEVWYSQHTWAMDKQEYIWGFRDAEKCYGIGVE